MGVFDLLPGLGGDGPTGEDQLSGSSDDNGGGATDSSRLADLGPAGFRERAETLAGRSDVPTLDFTVDSLDLLDELATGPPSDVDDPVAYGSYLGETIVREFGGEWTAEDGDWQVAVALPDDRTTIAVFEGAKMSIAGEPVFSEVVARLELVGGERTSETSDDTATTDGDAPLDSRTAGDTDDEPGATADSDRGESTTDPEEGGPTTNPHDEDPPPEEAEPVAPDRDVLRLAADALATDRPERDLDLTPGSLPRLDALLDEQLSDRFRADGLTDRTVDREDSDDPLMRLGAYYGEVLVRRLDGEWVATDDGEGVVAVPDADGPTEQVDVFSIARNCLTAPSTLAYRYDALLARLGLDHPTVSDGRADVFVGERASLSSSDVITQFAATSESFVDAWPAFSLDYSPQSLPALDDIVDDVARDAHRSDVPLADETDPESLWLTARATAAGAYFAAVLLRHRGAQWRIGDDVELVIDRPGGERTVDPVATAADCLRGEGRFVDAYAALVD